jgi:hypothetical protein
MGLDQTQEKKILWIIGIWEYNILTPFTWSNVIQEHFFLLSRLPCALLSFKKTQINVIGKFYKTVRRRCVDCGSIFDGIVEDIPCEKAILYYHIIKL